MIENKRAIYLLQTMKESFSDKNYIMVAVTDTVMYTRDHEKSSQKHDPQFPP